MHILKISNLDVEKIKKIPLTRKEWNMKMINLKHIKHQSKFKKV